MKQEKYETRFPKPSNAIDLFESRSDRFMMFLRPLRFCAP
jgi:hypothetical protein